MSKVSPSAEKVNPCNAELSVSIFHLFEAKTASNYKYKLYF